MNNSGGYAPYMFGQSFGMAGNTPNNNNNMPNNNYAGQSTRRDAFNVRDCMYWPASLGDTSRRSTGNMNQGSYPMNQNYQSMNRGSPMPMTGGYGTADPYTFHTGEYGTGEPQVVQQPTQPVKAFIQPGEGGQRVQIPCHMGAGAGQVPPVQPMQAMGYKVQVPSLPPTPPVDFEIGQK